MQYAQLNPNGSFNHQITSDGSIEWDATHFCPASKLTQEEQLKFNIVPLIETTAPLINENTEIVMRDGGTIVGGQWQYKWKIEKLTAEQVEAKRQASVPTSVSMAQARLSLLNAGMLSQVNSLIASMPGVEGEAARVRWEFSGDVSRTQTLVLSLGAALKLTTEQLDSLFIEAAKL